jgi:acyl carrier protein
MDNILSRIEVVFQDVFDAPGLKITSDSNASQIEGWDSLAHINLIMAIEQDLSIRFALSELEAMKNVGDMLDLIMIKLKEI